MSDYQITQIGAPDQWRNHHGGFDEARSRDGRRVVDHELTMQYIGMTANALEPGEEAGYWHTHSRIEELYVFLEGRGQMGLGDDLVEVGPGTVVRVGQDVVRTWRAQPTARGSCAGCASGRGRSSPAPARRQCSGAGASDALERGGLRPGVSACAGPGKGGGPVWRHPPFTRP